VLFVSLPATRNESVHYDDQLYLSAAQASHGLTPEGIQFAFATVDTLYWHPLAWLSHEVDISLFGASASGHHFVSILFHAMTPALLCLVLRRVGCGAYIAAASSLFWALHPLRVESFAWIAERKDVLCAFFVIATVAAYLRYARGQSWPRYAAWLLLAFLALMSKPTAVTLPVILLLLDFWPLRRLGFSASPAVETSPAPAESRPAQPPGRAARTTAKRETLYKKQRSKLAPKSLPTSPALQSRWFPLIEKLPLVVASAVVLCLTVSGQRANGSTARLGYLSFGTRMANAVVGYARYLGKIVWPVDLACLYPYHLQQSPAMVLLAALLLVGISIFAIAQVRRRPWLLMGWLWFVLALLPNSGLIQAGLQSIADRFTEIPMIGLAIAGACSGQDLLETHPRWRRGMMSSTAAVLAVFAILTVRQIGFWHDSETLFRHAVAVEDSFTMRGNLAETLEGKGRFSEAEQQYRTAVRLAPDRPEALTSLANLLLHSGRLDEASQEASAAVALAPGSLPAAQTLAKISLRRGDTVDVLRQLDRAAALGGDRSKIAIQLNDAGASLASRSRPAQAEPLIRRAVELDPALVQAHRNLILALQDQGRLGEARAALQQAVQATGPQREYADLAHELRVVAPVRLVPR
jgi:protein O-mannosyl-transferase